MRTVRTDELEADGLLPSALYHGSGEKLLPAGTVLDPELLEIFKRFGIQEVYLPEKGEKVAEFVHEARNIRLAVDDLRPGERMSRPIYDRAGRLLLTADAAVSPGLPGALRRRGVTTIFVRRSPAAMRIEQARSFARAYQELVHSRARPPEPARVELDPERLIEPEKIELGELDAMIEQELEIRVSRRSRALAEEIVLHPWTRARTEHEKGSYLNLHRWLARETKALFECFTAGAHVDIGRVGGLARGVIGALLHDKDLLLSIADLRSGDYLADHSLATAIFAIHIATALGFNRAQIFEVAYGAFLHDVGMLRVPREIVEKPGELTEMERMEIRRHPARSLDMLQRVAGKHSGIPLSVPFVTYQSHERENGNGYPKGRRSTMIHDFAKIVAVADVFAAAASERPYRKAKLPYGAMEDVVLMGARRELHPDTIRGMLSSISLFPVGSFVELEGERLARVIAGNSSSYARPVVSILYEKGERLATPVRLDLAQEPKVRILRAAPPPQAGEDVMEGF